MKVSVIGAGAIGGWLTAGFVKGGAEATVLARGASLVALQNTGLVLEADGTAETIPVTATNDPDQLRGADLLLLGVKAHDLPALAPVIEQIMTAETLVMPAVNGLPFWFLSGFGGPAEGKTLASVDPGGTLAKLMPVERVVANVVHAASRVAAPGHIQLVKANKVILGGQPDGLADIAACLQRGGIPIETTDAIHREVWMKLWGNSNMNPLSALARADAAQLHDDPGANTVIKTMMQEMADLGARIGLEGFDDIDGRMATTRKLGPIRTSMLQDVEAGRPFELGPILGALVELAELVDQPVPMMKGIHGLAGLLDRNLRVE
ncbi:2-dehydropantoate 2-reductase [Donghicola sp.]|jgi:2-dehydropantoate 2-reductase|uniref:ketopantoate reductase family protein n=1 Tax=Donghicola sp. TaxID=1929294 RepID=UPI0025E628D5|nr:2-dehydropantoate 2-reductase [Donghicola sp.]MCT4576463.1 2-dehydropantoate 2-reductase [Donghicola sp.]